MYIPAVCQGFLRARARYRQLDGGNARAARVISKATALTERVFPVRRGLFDGLVCVCVVHARCYTTVRFREYYSPFKVIYDAYYFERVRKYVYRERGEGTLSKQHVYRELVIMKKKRGTTRFLSSRKNGFRLMKDRICCYRDD